MYDPAILGGRCKCGFAFAHRPLSVAPSEHDIAMSTLQQQVAETFLTRLSDAGTLDAKRLEQMRALLASSKKPKADDFVKLFSQPAGDDIK